jgi:hypothetical protein
MLAFFLFCSINLEIIVDTVSYMCCAFVFIDRRFDMNSLEGMDKYTETDGPAQN